MALTNPSPDINYYYIGKGAVYWKGTSDTAYRHLGNCPKFEFNPSIDKIDHFSSQTGIKQLDRTIVTQQLATLAITLEEYTAQNLALAMMGGTPDPALNLSTTGDTTISQGTIANLADVTGLVAGRTYNVSGIGIPAGATFTYVSGSSVTLDDGELATATGTGVALTITAAIAFEVFSQSQITGSFKFVGANDVGATVTAVFANVIVRPNGAIGFIDDGLGTLELNADVYKEVGYNAFGRMYVTPPA